MEFSNNNVPLPEKQAEFARSLLREIEKKKLELADCVLQIRGLTQKKAELEDSVRDMSQSFMETARILGVMEGVPLDTPSASSWRLKFDTMEFTTEPQEQEGT